MDHLSIFISLSTFITIHKAQSIITPTSITSNTENYINSEYNTTSGNIDYFYGDTINCGTEICNIECDAYQGCYSSTINIGSTTTTLNLKCSESHSCYYMQINADGNAMSGLDLQCNGEYSCQYMSVEANALTITTINVKCSAQYSCQYMNVKTGADITNVDINCNGNYSCIYAGFVLGTADKVVLYCDGYQSCHTLSSFDGTTDDLSLNCQGQRSCMYANIDYIIGNDMFILDCLSSESCERMNMYLHSTKVDANIDINCMNSACGNTQFYIYGYNGNNAVSNNITVQCSDYDCYGIDFWFYNLYFVDIGCNDQYSCQTMYLRASLSKYLHLDCNDTYSCNEATIGCPYRDIGVCDIHCSSKGYACSSTTISVPSSYVYDYLDLQCDSILPNGCDALLVDCHIGSRTTIEYIYNYILDDYECSFSGGSYCCPYYDGHKTECTPNTNCVVDCESSDCSDGFIDGVDATFLTVNCGANNCTNSKIDCPDKGCIINCYGDNACSEATIIYNGKIADQGTVNINCRVDQSSPGYTCKSTTIHAENANTINVNCSACRQMTLNAQYANTVNIDTYEAYGSSSTQWNVNNAITVNFNSRGSYGSYYDRIQAENAGTLNVNCVSENDTYASACYAGGWYIPSNVTFNCYGTGCSFLSSIFPYGGVANLNFNMYPCGKCVDAADCLGKLNIYCPIDGTTFNTDQTLQSGQCSAATDCGCDTVISNAIFSATENTDKCYGAIGISESPTKASPTTSPTKITSITTTVHQSTDTKTPTMAPTVTVTDPNGGGGRADGANVMSVFISFAVVIAMVTSY